MSGRSPYRVTPKHGAMRTLVLGMILVVGVAGRVGASESPSVAALGPDTLPGFYRDPNSWFSRDKFYHFTISAAGSGGVYSLGREMGLGRWQSAAAGIVIMGTAGVLREIGTTDRTNLLTRTRISRKDLVWDGIGIAVGVSLTDLYYRHRRPQRPSPPPQGSRADPPEGSAAPRREPTASLTPGDRANNFATGEAIR